VVFVVYRGLVVSWCANTALCITEHMHPHMLFSHSIVKNMIFTFLVLQITWNPAHSIWLQLSHTCYATTNSQHSYVYTTTENQSCRRLRYRKLLPNPGHPECCACFSVSSCRKILG